MARKDAAEHGKGLGVGQGSEKPSRLALEGEDREKATRDDKRVKKRDGPTSLAASMMTSDPAAGRLPWLLPFLQLLVGVFHHDDGGIDEHADGDGDAAQSS